VIETRTPSRNRRTVTARAPRRSATRHRCPANRSSLRAPGVERRPSPDPAVRWSLRRADCTDLVACAYREVRSVELGHSPAAAARPRRGRLYLRMLTERAITRATVTRATADWASIASFAPRVSGIVSVGLNAVALVNDTYR